MQRHQSDSAGLAKEGHRHSQMIAQDKSNHTDRLQSKHVDVAEIQLVGEESALKLPKIIPFETLSRCGGEVWIENGGQIYRLRRTKQGKLILTK